MIQIMYHGKPVLIALTRASAQEYIARHRPALQAKMSIKETHNGNGKPVTPAEKEA